MKLNVVIAGVGGQGNLFITRILTRVALLHGLQVVSTETIGAAQRGGSVVSHFRVSDRAVFSPLIPNGQAHILLAFEPVEGLRHAGLLAPNGLWVVNTKASPTVLTDLGLEPYPSSDEVLAELRRRSPNGLAINATDAAVRLGSSVVMNLVMLGALMYSVELFTTAEVKQVMQEMITPARLEPSLAALALGRELASSSQTPRWQRTGGQEE